MRVLLVLHEFPKPSETFLVAHFLGLLERGIDVHLLVEREYRELWSHYEALDRPGLRARVHGWPRGAGSWRAPFTFGGRIGRALLADPFGLLRGAAHELRRSPLAAAGRLALAAPILFLRPDLIHFEYGSLAMHWIEWRRLAARPAVVSFRGFDLAYYALERPDAYAQVWEDADAFHFLGGDLEELARRRGWDGHGLSARIAPAVDSEFFRPEERDASPAGDPERPLRVLSVGRLHWKKGYEHALAAVRGLVDAGLTVEYRVVGGGPAEEDVRARVRDLGLEPCVRLLGDRRPEEVREAFQWADLLLHAAVSEGFGNAVLEAQSMALPVVCSDAEGLAENVAPGTSGLVTPRRDAPAMTRAMSELATDGALRRRMGAAGRERARAEFTREKQIDAFVELYRRVLEKR